jgi:hypothetical protein
MSDRLHLRGIPPPAGVQIRGDLPELAPGFDLQSDIFPFVTSPPDVLVVQVQLPPDQPQAPDLQDGCLRDEDAASLVTFIRLQLISLGLDDADVRQNCSRLELPQSVPGSDEKTLRSATTVARGVIRRCSRERTLRATAP